MQDNVKKMKILAALLLLAAFFAAGCGRESEDDGLDELQAQPAGETDTDAGEFSVNRGEDPDIPKESPEDVAQPEKAICVFVCGEVASPGVYELALDSRVYQAVEAAGGLLGTAAGDYVNQAERITDGQRIYIPSLEEVAEGTAELAAGGGNMSGAQDSGGKVNLNTAGKEELMTLTGIGEKKAEAILSYRDANGGFRSIDELMQVEGIKEGTFEKIKEDIII